MSMLNAVVPARSAVNQTKATQVVAASARPSVPIVIQKGIHDLLVGFPAGSASQPQEDRIRLLQIYAQACADADVELFVAQIALRHLQFHNPRNPFPPTPQDLFEQCEKIQTAFMMAVFDFFLGSGSWGCGYPSTIKNLGPPPSDGDCVVPSELICDWLRDQIERDYLKAHRERLLGISTCSIEFERHSRFRLELLPIERFEKIPVGGFPEGVFDFLCKLRSRLAQDNAATAKWQRADRT